MLRALVIAAGVALLIGGGERLFHDLTNTTEVTMTCEEFASARPRALRLRVTGCEIDYLNAGFSLASGHIEELFFPARPAKAAPDTPSPIVAATTDATAIALAQETLGDGRQPDNEQFDVMMLKILTTLRVAREIEGYARAGFIQTLRARRAISGLKVPLTRDVAVVDLHASPDMKVSLLTTGAGVLLLAATALATARARRTRAQAPIVEPPPEPASAAHVQALSAAARSLRGVLLVNLPAGAGREAIETAPALGTRAEAVAAISAVLPGLEFDERGRALFQRAGDYLSLDIGADDPVAAVVASAEGHEGVEALGRLVRATGWRAYVPRMGYFLDDDVFVEMPGA